MDVRCPGDDDILRIYNHTQGDKRCQKILQILVLRKRSGMPLDEMLAEKLAPNMKKYLAAFQNETIPQAYGISGQGLILVDNSGILR